MTRIFKNLTAFFMALVMLLGVATSVDIGIIAHAANYNYNSSKSLAYASTHWNDGKGLCAEFVSDCIKDGGLNSYSASSTTLMNLLKNEVGAENVHKLTPYGSKYRYRICDNIGKVAAGDLLFWYCSNCGKYMHSSLCNGEHNGYISDYAHNKAHNGEVNIYRESCYKCGHAYEGVYCAHLSNSSGTDTTPPIQHIIDNNRSSASVVLPKAKGMYGLLLNTSTLRICCEVESAEKVAHAVFKTWTTGDLSDVMEREAKYNSASTFFVDIPLSDYRSRPDVFITHFIARDSSGNECSMEYAYWADTNPPEIEGSYSFMISPNTLRVCVVPKDVASVNHVDIYTWTTSDQSDLKCRRANYNGAGTFFVDIPISEHRANPDVFISHPYLYNAFGYYSSCESTLWVDKPAIKGSYSLMISPGILRVCVVPKDAASVDHVDIYTWTTSDQSDLKCRRANYNGAGTYFIDIPVSEHRANPDVYISHPYVYNSSGYYSSCETTLWVAK